MVRPLSIVSAEARSAMRRLESTLETLDLDDVRRWVSRNDDDYLVENHIPLETWNRFAARNGLPQNLQLSQLVWSAETVWLVEFPSGPHGLAASYYDKVLDRQLGDLMESPRDMKLNAPNQPSYEPDSSFRPKRNVPGIQAPPGMVHEDWVTVILEILYAQSWASVLAKVNVYRQRAGVEYIICIRMSELLNNWTYELHDVRDQNPVVRHHFDFRGGITDAERGGIGGLACVGTTTACACGSVAASTRRLNVPRYYRN